MAILHDLVFAVCKDVDDLRFWFELLDKRGEKIIHMLSTLLDPRHSPEQASSAPTASTTFMALSIQATTTKNMEKSCRSNA
jgi:hypothetical protein